MGDQLRFPRHIYALLGLPRSCADASNFSAKALWGVGGRKGIQLSQCSILAYECFGSELNLFVALEHLLSHGRESGLSYRLVGVVLSIPSTLRKHETSSLVASLLTIMQWERPQVVLALESLGSRCRKEVGVFSVVDIDGTCAIRSRIS